MNKFSEEDILHHLKKKETQVEFNLVVTILTMMTTDDLEAMRNQTLKELTNIGQHQLATILAYLEGARMIEKFKTSYKGKSSMSIRITPLGEKYVECYGETPYFKETEKRVYEILKNK